MTATATATATWTTMTNRSASHNSKTIDDSQEEPKSSNSSPCLLVLENYPSSSRNRAGGTTRHTTTTSTSTARRRTSQHQRLGNIFFYSIFAVQCFLLQWNHSQEASSSLSQIQQQQQQSSFSFFLLDRSSMSSYTPQNNNNLLLTQQHEECIDTTTATPTTTQEGTVFLHLGPRKTGSTSLQNYLTQHADYIRQHYHATYLGKVNPRNFHRRRRKSLPQDYLRQLNQFHVANGTLRFREIVRKHVLEQRHDVILSDEALDQQSLVELLQHLVVPITISNNNDDTPPTHRPLVYKTVPIFVYRRYHEWLLSMYRFEYAPKWYEANEWTNWPTNIHNKTTLSTNTSNFIHEHHDTPLPSSSFSIPTFAEYLSRFLSNDAPPPLLQSIRQFQQAWQHVHLKTKTNRPSHSVLPPCVHILRTDHHPTNQSLTEQFMALVVNSSSTTTLRRSSPHEFPPETRRSNVNPQVAFATDAERMALFLHYEGVIGRTTEETNPRKFRKGDRLTRRRWVSKIQEHMVDLYYANDTAKGMAERSNATDSVKHAHHIVPPPWQCPSARDMERLWNQTCMLEELVLRMTNPPTPNDESTTSSSQTSLEDLRTHFDQAVQERRFCNLDIAQMWKHDPRWRQFVNDTFAEQQHRARTSNPEEQE